MKLERTLERIREGVYNNDIASLRVAMETLGNEMAKKEPNLDQLNQIRAVLARSGIEFQHIPFLGVLDIIASFEFGVERTEDLKKIASYLTNKELALMMILATRPMHMPTHWLGRLATQSPYLADTIPRKWRGWYRWRLTREGRQVLAYALQQHIEGALRL